jgi:HD domain/GAF domain
MRIETADNGRTASGGLFEISELAQEPSVERALSAVRQLLGMDVAYATEFADGNQVFRFVDGDPISFGVSSGYTLPLDQTYCQKILEGRLSNLIPDVRGDERANALPITAAANVGAFASVPLRFSDGRLFGTLCAASHDRKPNLGYRDLQFLLVFARMVADQLEREQLERSVQNLELQATAVGALIAAVESRDAYTGEHSQRVAEQAVAIALRLGLDESQVMDVRHVALIHDIGKLAMPDTILNKRGPLTDDEWEQVRLHPIAGETLIKALPGLAHLAPAVRAEHERWDGGGYPDGLAGEQIPLASRITFVCDAYEAMISDRSYRRALPPQLARERLAEGSGSQFCPTAARALLDILAG